MALPHPCRISKFECVVLSPASCDDTLLLLVVPAALPHPCQMCPHPISGKNPELGEDPNFSQTPKPKETPLKMSKAVCSVLKGFGHTVWVFAMALISRGLVPKFSPQHCGLQGAGPCSWMASPTMPRQIVLNSGGKLPGGTGAKKFRKHTRPVLGTVWPHLK